MKNICRFISIMLYVSTITTTLQCCMITFINDTAPGNIFILNHTDKYNTETYTPDNFIFIPKGKQRRFNDPHEHAHFSVYVHSKNSLNLIYEVRQIECGDNGNPHIKFSELTNNTFDNNLFEVIDKNRIRSSMVRDLPMIKTATEQLIKPDIYKSMKSCSACDKN